MKHLVAVAIVRAAKNMKAFFKAYAITNYRPISVGAFRRHSFAQQFCWQWSGTLLYSTIYSSCTTEGKNNSNINDNND